jgi:sugar lactone lactonase YvrE
MILATLFLLGFGAESLSATIDTVAGNGDPAVVGQPFGVEIGPDGALYICEVQNHRVLRLDRESVELTTVAGSGTQGYSGDGGPATSAQLFEPYEVRFDRDGNMFFVEMKNHLVRRVDAKTKQISTVAGTGEAGFGGDGGPATKAQFRMPHSIALYEAGGRRELYIADIGNHRIRRVDLNTGLIDTIAGTGEKKLPVAGQPALGKSMVGPRALFVDGDTLWIALREGHSVWRMQLAGAEAGILRHVAGTGQRGFSGDGGPAKEATFDGPKGIAVGLRGDVYVVDTENQAIRKIDTTTGIITTIAGSGPKARGYGGDGGLATKAKLDRPHGVCVDRDGVVYIGDTNNHRVRRVKP